MRTRVQIHLLDKFRCARLNTWNPTVFKCKTSAPSENLQRKTNSKMPH